MIEEEASRFKATLVVGVLAGASAVIASGLFSMLLEWRTLNEILHTGHQHALFMAVPLALGVLPSRYRIASRS
ncbi:MAG: hypothetical protein GY944_10930 [bacterium]|nr:hypothetical protein [bacterium]